MNATSSRRRSAKTRLRVETLDVRCVPAVVTELPLGSGTPTPLGVVAGPGGIWFTDSTANSIGRLATDGNVTEFRLASPNSDPRGITVGSDNALWFTLFGADRIGRLDPANGSITEFELPVNSGPSEIASGSDGRLWFTNLTNDTIGAITTGGTVTSFDVPGAGSQPFGITAGPNNSLWFTQIGSNQIGAITTTGTITEFDAMGVPAPGAGITTGPDGNLYFTEPNGGAITRITPTGEQTTFITLASTGPVDVVAAADGTLWYTQPDANKVGRVTPTGAIVEYLLPPNSEPTGITIGPDNNVWFTQFGGDAIGKLTPAGVLTSFTDGLTTGAGPRDIVTGPDGALWFTSNAGNSIGRIATDGKITEFPLPTANSQPTGITRGPDNRLWFTNFGTDKIGAITAAGKIDEFAVPGTGNGLLDIVAGPDGALWFTEFESSQIGRITTDGKVTEFDTPTKASQPSRIVSAGDGRLWFTQAASNKLGQITIAGAATETSDGLSDGSGPAGLAVLPNGKLVVAQTTANQLATVTLSADLSITITDGATTAAAGTKLTYTIVAANAKGGDTVANATVAVPLPTGLTNVSWTAVVAGGAAGKVTGTGAIAETVTLPSEGSITYTLIGTIDSKFTGDLKSTATVSSGITDPTPANNTATDTTTITAGGGTTGVSGVFAVGTDRGTPNRVRQFSADGKEVFSVTPFDAGFTGGVRTAVADFNADGVADLVVGTGPGAVTRVRVLDGKTQAELFSVQPFESAFLGGTYVSAGDVTGDNVPDVIISPDEGGGPRVDVYSGATFKSVAGFFGITDTNFRGGARTAVGDVNGDGKGDLAVAAGFGGGPRVAVFDGTTLSGTPTTLFNDFFAFEQGLRNGVFIALGDTNGDGKADVIAGGGPGGGPRVTVFSAADLISSKGGTQTQLVNFFAGDPNNRGGVRLTVKNLDGDTKADLVVGSGTGAGSRVTSYLGATIASATPPVNLDFDAFPGFAGGVFVG